MFPEKSHGNGSFFFLNDISFCLYCNFGSAFPSIIINHQLARASKLSLTHQIFIEHLLCDRHSSRRWGSSREKGWKELASRGLHSRRNLYLSFSDSPFRQATNEWLFIECLMCWMLDQGWGTLCTANSWLSNGKARANLNPHRINTEYYSGRWLRVHVCSIYPDCKAVAVQKKERWGCVSGGL